MFYVIFQFDFVFPHESVSRKIVQSVKCLPCKQKDPSTHVEMPVVVIHACGPNSGEMETGRS